jgi:hypothetical protein
VLEASTSPTAYLWYPVRNDQWTGSPCARDLWPLWLSTLRFRLSVGELGKKLSPSKRWSWRIRECVREWIKGSMFCFGARKCSWRCFLIFTWFADPLTLCETISESMSYRRSASWFRTAEIWRIRDTIKLWTSKSLRNLSSAVNSEAQSRDLDDWWFSRMEVRRSTEDQVKGVASKVRVRAVNWWQVCKYVKLSPQIMGCMPHPEISNFRMWIERIIK